MPSAGRASSNRGHYTPSNVIAVVAKPSDPDLCILHTHALVTHSLAAGVRESLDNGAVMVEDCDAMQPQKPCGQLAAFSASPAASCTYVDVEWLPQWKRCHHERLCKCLVELAQVQEMSDGYVMNPTLLEEFSDGTCDWQYFVPVT